MLLYRVAPHLHTAEPDEPGHPTYVPPQTRLGRWNNPDQYTMWYFGESPEAAVGETFAHHAHWTTDMFEYPALPEAHRALLTFHLDERTSLLDLDDAQTLLNWRLRPTQVVIRNYTATQSYASRFYLDTHSDDTRRWAGVRWWSIHRPQWPLVALWSPPGEPLELSLEQVEPLTLDHPAVIESGRTLAKLVDDAR